MVSLARPTRSVSVLVAAVLLASCGSGDSTGTQDGAAPAEPAVDDETAVTDVVNTYFASLASGDYATACAQLSDQAQQQLIELTKALPGQSVATCEEGLAAGFTGISKAEQAALGEITVASVAVTGDSATVVVEGALKDVPLERQGGGWVISELVAA
jgi:hypothetical protein